MLAALAAVWSLLAASFLAALLLLLRWAPAPRPGRAGLVIAGLFQDLIRYGKTKRGCGQLPGWLRLLQVPKRWGTEEHRDCERSSRIHVLHIGTKP